VNWEEFEKHKPFAGEKKPSMLRRRVGHDYQSRRIYLITMTVVGRRMRPSVIVSFWIIPGRSRFSARVA